MKLTKKEKQRVNEWMARQQLKEYLKSLKPKADHRHNWKDGKRVRIFGSSFHVHCAVKDCEEFKVI